MTRKSKVPTVVLSDVSPLMKGILQGKPNGACEGPIRRLVSYPHLRSLQPDDAVAVGEIIWPEPESEQPNGEAAANEPKVSRVLILADHVKHKPDELKSRYNFLSALEARKHIASLLV